MSLTLHVRDDGTVHLNDAPVEVPSGVSPFRAGIDAAKRAAATMNEEIVPLTARTDAETFELLIVRGAVVDAESVRAADPDSIAVKLPTPAPAPTLPENATDDQRLDERVDEAVAVPVASKGEYEPKEPARNAVPRRAVLAGALAIGGGFGVWALTRQSSPAPVPVASTTEPVPSLPGGQDAPGGWSERASWVVTDIADPRPSLVTHEGLVIALTQPSGTGTLRLSAMRAANGKPVWHAPLDAGVTVTAGPTLVAFSGEARVVVATQDDVLTWDASSGNLRSKTALPSDANNVTTSAFGVWTNHDKQRQHKALIDGTFKSFTLPKDSAPLGVHGKQLLAADAKGQVWKLTAGKATGKPTKLSGPKGYSPGTVILTTEDLLIIGWNKDRKLALRAYALTDLKPKWTTKAQSGWQGFLPITAVSPDRSWAIVANRVVDLSNGTIHAIASKWSTVGISDTHAWGDDGSVILTCTKDGRVLPAAQPPTKVNTALISGGTRDHVLVTGSIGTTSTLYSLRRAAEGKVS